MRRSTTGFTCLALALGALATRAEAEERLTPHEATVMPDRELLLPDPLALGLAGSTLTLGPAELPPPIRALVLDPAFHATRVTVYLRDDRIVEALGGTTNGDVPLLDDAGQRVGDRLRLNARLAVYGRFAHPSGDALLRVHTGDRVGWMHPQHVTLGVTRPVAAWIGRHVLKPLASLGTRLRGKRLFHPDGHVFRGTVTPVVSPGSPFAPTARGLRGAVLARVGGGARELDPETGQEPAQPDGISFGLQIKDTDAPLLDPTPGAHEQHLTLVSRARDWKALLTETVGQSNPHSFFANAFHATNHYVVQERRVQLRMIPEAEPFEAAAGDRVGGLREAIRAGRARWYLQVRSAEASAVEEPWYTLAAVRLHEELPDYDQDAFHISTSLAGRGLREVDTWGHAVRAGAYAGSQAARPAGEDPPVDSAIDADRRARIPGPGLVGALGQLGAEPE